jgi:hypothetical protein
VGPMLLWKRSRTAASVRVFAFALCVVNEISFERVSYSANNIRVSLSFVKLSIVITVKWGSLFIAKLVFFSLSETIGLLGSV